MLAIVVLAAAVVFLLLWKSGILDELADVDQEPSTGPQRSPFDFLRPRRGGDMAKRLEVFENFLNRLSLPDEEEDEE